MRILLILTIIFAFQACCGSSEKKNAGLEPKDSLLILENKNSIVGISLLGGAYIDFHQKNSGINPFTWKLTKDEMPANNNQAVFQGHFLCLGRWGAPTEGEINAGVPHNGQAGNLMWSVDSVYKTNFVKISAVAPLDGIFVERTVELDKSNAIFLVNEKFKNTTSIGRLFNVVQHATIGFPFLDSTTIIDSNAGKGFMQSLSWPDPTKYEYIWPNGLIDSTKMPIDLTKSNTSKNYVSTHIFNSEIGWITATNPGKKLLVGYIWNTSDYPWLNVWHQNKDGKLWAKGLEYGTTGIGRSYQDLLSIDSRFYGHQSFFFLDAGQEIEKSFICFQISLPDDYEGVNELFYKDGIIKLLEKNATKNDTLKLKVNLNLEFLISRF